MVRRNLQAVSITVLLIGVPALSLVACTPTPSPTNEQTPSVQPPESPTEPPAPTSTGPETSCGGPVTDLDVSMSMGGGIWIDNCLAEIAVWKGQVTQRSAITVSMTISSCDGRPIRDGVLIIESGSGLTKTFALSATGGSRYVAHINSSPPQTEPTTFEILGGLCSADKGLTYGLKVQWVCDGRLENAQIGTLSCDPLPAMTDPRGIADRPSSCGGLSGREATIYKLSSGTAGIDCYSAPAASVWKWHTTVQTSTTATMVNAKGDQWDPSKNPIWTNVASAGPPTVAAGSYGWLAPTSATGCFYVTIKNTEGTCVNMWYSDIFALDGTTDVTGLDIHIRLPDPPNCPDTKDTCP